jgi:hypothetical protein
VICLQCRILQRGSDIAWLKVLIVVENLGAGCADSQLVEDIGYTHTRAPDARTTSTLLTIKSDAVKFAYAAPVGVARG